MLNNTATIGRFADTPELKLTNGGNSVVTFTLAVDRSYVKKGEECQTDWIDFVAWGQTAEFICNNFAKGSLIAVTGHIQTRTWADKGGKNHKAVEVVADKVDFCGAREKKPAAEGYTDDSDLKEINVEELADSIGVRTKRPGMSDVEFMIYEDEHLPF